MGRPEKFTDFADKLIRDINRGEYPPGKRLPSENQLKELFDLSRSTVRKALNILKTRGLVTSKGGKGYFVVDKNHPVTGNDNDVALILGLNFADWSLHHQPCMLYTLLEENLAVHNRNLQHLQPDRFNSADDFIQFIESFPGNVIISMTSSIRYLNENHRLNCFFKRTDKRIILFDFEEPKDFFAVDTVYVDWQSVLDEIVEMCVEAGLKKIVFAGYNRLSWSKYRKHGFLLAMRKAGLWDFNQASPVVSYPKSIKLDKANRPTPENRSLAALNLAKYLKRYPDIEAVVCAHDYIIEEIHSLLPTDKLPLMIGFDNQPWVRDNRISSVTINMGALVKTLMTLITATSKSNPTYIPVPAVLMKR